MYFHHLGTVTCHLLYAGPSTSSLPNAIQCMHAHHFCWKPELISPGFKQCYWSNLSITLKNIFMYATLLRHEMILLAQEKNLFAQC